MTDFNVRYRILGPTNIHEGGELGNGILLPLNRGNQNAVAALKYTISAESKEEAEKAARHELQSEAKKAVNVLSFVAEQGILLGPHYKIRAKDAANQSMVDVGEPIDEFDIKTAHNVHENIQSILNEDDESRQSLNWYNIGLATSVSEDKLVALWTGIEAFADTQEKEFSESENETYENAKDGALAAVDQDEHPSLHGRIGQLFGEKLKQESIPEAVTRLIQEEVPVDRISEVERDEIGQVVKELYTSRNKIVHEGKDVADIENVTISAEKLALVAEEILREILTNRLPEAFAGFIGDGIPERYEYRHLVGYDWILRVFDSDYESALSSEEIVQRAFALTREISGIRGIPLINLTGENNPLIETEDGNYRLNPDFDFEEHCE